MKHGDHRLSSLQHLIDFLLEQSSISKDMGDYVYSNLLTKFDHLRAFLIETPALHHLLTLIDDSRLHIYDVLQEAEYSSIKVDALQLLFQFQVLLSQIEALKSFGLRDDRRNVVLIYANFLHTILEPVIDWTDKDVARLDQSIAFFLQYGDMLQERTHAEQCDRLYSLEQILDHVRAMSVQLQIRHKNPKHEEIRVRLTDDCSEVCVFACSLSIWIIGCQLLIEMLMSVSRFESDTSSDQQMDKLELNLLDFCESSSMTSESSRTACERHY